MANDVKVKITADVEDIRDKIKLIDQDLAGLGNKGTEDNPDITNNTDSPDSTRDPNLNTRRRDRERTLLLRELKELKDTIISLNESIKDRFKPPTSPPIGDNDNTPPPSGGPPPPPPGDNGPTPPSNDNDNENSDRNSNKISTALSKLASLWHIYIKATAWANSSQSRMEMARRTYGPTGAFGSDFNLAGGFAAGMGRPLGYSYSEVMEATRANLSTGGYSNLEALQADMESILRISKALSLDQTAIARTSGTMVAAGTFKLSEQQKFANMIAKAIVDTGMVGREEETLKVYENMFSTLSQKSAKVDQEAYLGLTGMYEALVKQSPTLAGQRGANVTNTIAETFASGDKSMLYLAGLGTRYLGPGGENYLRELGETNPSAYMQEIAKTGLMDYYLSSPQGYERLRSSLRDKLGSFSNVDEFIKLYQQYRSGEINDDTLKARLDELNKVDEKTGKIQEDKAITEKVDTYFDSTLSSLQQFDNALQNTTDELGNLLNVLTGPFKEVFSNLSPGVQQALVGGGTVGTALVGGAIAPSIVRAWRSGGLTGLRGLASRGVTATAPILAKGAPIISAIPGAVNAYSSYKKGDEKGTYEGIGEGIGGFGGALLGAKVGALGGPIGIVAGSIIGGILGNVLGGWGGGKLAELKSPTGKTTPTTSQRSSATYGTPIIKAEDLKSPTAVKGATAVLSDGRVIEVDDDYLSMEYTGLPVTNDNSPKGTTNLYNYYGATNDYESVFGVYGKTIEAHIKPPTRNTDEESRPLYKSDEEGETAVKGAVEVLDKSEELKTYKPYEKPTTLDSGSQDTFKFLKPYEKPTTLDKENAQVLPQAIDSEVDATLANTEALRENTKQLQKGLGSLAIGDKDQDWRKEDPLQTFISKLLHKKTSSLIGGSGGSGGSGGTRDKLTKGGPKNSIGKTYTDKDKANLREWANEISGGVMSDDVFDAIVEEATKQGVPIDVALSLATAESNGNQSVVSEVGALGVMQLMPETAAGLGVDPHDMRQNVAGGIKYLKGQYDKFGDWSLAFAAYNAGPGAVEQYNGVPPYAETQNYVDKINGFIAKAPQASGITPDLGSYTGEGGSAEGKYWERQFGKTVSTEGMKEGTLNALDTAGKIYYEMFNKKLVLSSGTEGSHLSNGAEFGHNAGYKFDIVDAGGSDVRMDEDGPLFTKDFQLSPNAEKFIEALRKIGLGVNLENVGTGNVHLDVSADPEGYEWSTGARRGGFKNELVVAGTTAVKDEDTGEFTEVEPTNTVIPKAIRVPRKPTNHVIAKSEVFDKLPLESLSTPPIVVPTSTSATSTDTPTSVTSTDIPTHTSRRPTYTDTSTPIVAPIPDGIPTLAGIVDPTEVYTQTIPRYKNIDLGSIFRHRGRRDRTPFSRHTGLGGIFREVTDIARLFRGLPRGIERIPEIGSRLGSLFGGSTDITEMFDPTEIYTQTIPRYKDTGLGGLFRGIGGLFGGIGIGTNRGRGSRSPIRRSRSLGGLFRDLESLSTPPIVAPTPDGIPTPAGIIDPTEVYTQTIPRYKDTGLGGLFRSIGRGSRRGRLGGLVGLGLNLLDKFLDRPKTDNQIPLGDQDPLKAPISMDSPLESNPLERLETPTTIPTTGTPTETPSTAGIESSGELTINVVVSGQIDGMTAENQGIIAGAIKTNVLNSKNSLMNWLGRSNDRRGAWN